MLEYRIDRINRIGFANVLKVAAIVCVILYIIKKCKAKKRVIHQQPEEHKRANPQRVVYQQQAPRVVREPAPDVIRVVRQPKGVHVVHEPVAPRVVNVYH